MNAPAFQFYAQDFLTGCMYLTNEEIGMYIKMLAKQWTDGKIPKKRLGFLIGIEWDSISDELKSKFKDLGDYVLNERLENERSKKENFIKKQVENGKKGGRPKKKDSSLDTTNTNNKTQIKPNYSKNNNPTITQKKPLEDEDEIEEENRSNGKDSMKGKPNEVVHPFDSEEFKIQWHLWKDYKRQEFGFKFKSHQSEQASLTQLNNISSDEQTAIAIIHQSMSNGWKGFFPLKNNTNEQRNKSSKGRSNGYSNDFKRKIAEGLQSG